MKLSKIAQICKKHTNITVLYANGVQWFAIGAAAYAAYGIPRLRTAEEVLLILDVPEDKRDAFQVEFADVQQDERFADSCSGEAVLRGANYTFVQRGSFLRPMYDDDGCAWWLNECYLAPVEETADMTYWLRPCDGIGYGIAVKKGFAIVALIGIRLPNTELEESAHEIRTGTALGWKKGYRVPKEQVDRMGGLQMIVYTGEGRREDEEPDEYEQETLE